MHTHTLWTRRGLVAATLFPILWLAFFYGFVFRARMHLGHWPRYAHPDPKDLDFTLHHVVLHYGILAFPFIAIVAVAFGIAARVHDRALPMWLIVSAGLLPVLLAVFLNVEPYDFIGWFMD